jgi:hypothetical protein
MKPWKLAVALAPFLLACSFSPANIQSRQTVDLEARSIRRIAVFAPAAPDGATAKNPLLGVPPEKKAEAQDPEEVLSRLVYAAMVAMPTWQIIADSEVREASHSVGPSDEPRRLRRIGELVYADAIISGRVLRYRERIGGDIGVKSPASVAFVLDLIDVQRGDVVWSGRFDETQKSLTENIFSFGDARDRGFKWLTAEQLMQDGVRKAVQQLHQSIGLDRGS